MEDQGGGGRAGAIEGLLSRLAAMGPTLDEAMIDAMRDRSPRFAELLGKSWDLPGYCCPIRYLHRTIAMMGLMSELGPEGTPATLYGQALEAFSSAAGYPFYVVNPDLLQAVVDTDPPPYWDVVSNPAPFKATYFLPPRGALTSPEGEPLSSIQLMVTTAQEFIEAAMSIAGHQRVGAEGLDPAITHSVRVSVVSEQGSLLFANMGARHGLVNLGVPIEESGFDDVGMTPEARGFLGLMRDTVAQLCLILATRDDLSTEPVLKKVARKSGREFWTPRMAGPRRVNRPAVRGDSTGRHVRGHIRRGHWKMQPHGKGRKLRRPIWVDQAWAGGGE